MEEEGIGMVMARASELKSKFADCIIHRRRRGGPNEEEEDDEDEDEEEEEEEEGSLVNIRDALESLEQQLASLQALQQQQRYERESSLFQIDRSRKMLLGKLTEYKGDNLEVIQEALTFAGGTLDYNDDDLLLPPYPSHLPDLFVMDNLYPSSKYSNLTKNGKKSIDVSEERQKKKPQGVRHVLGLLAKSVLTFVGVVSVLSLAGFKPTIRKDSAQFKIQEVLKRRSPVECPPGKVLVMEEGQPRCLVKERVEIPFDLDVSAPKINYGFG
ncbi:uncharacterized protein A4U43_C03F22400 [Asparagus officinalis]|uniref:Plastid division protein PDV2 n=1 Tax=Asparagus officinalis TaxID=4686 RepID=A0A5P1FDY5_ASPOF|nr:plastid division protein PDV2 [Asparagus officinalis]ONK75963.1 uncharacterized protein A4U43_C03F22400 [Asparagus officinalis]